MIRRTDNRPSIVTPATVISDDKLLGPYFAGDSWLTWHAVLKAAYAQPLSASELELFHSVAGGRNPPSHRVKELWCIVGRRGGKDSIASAIATAAAITPYSQYMRPGERAQVLCLAVNRDQARIVNRYVKGYFDEVPLLKALVQRQHANGVELVNAVDVVVSTNSFRSLRGATVACAIMDEVSFWRDEDSANPDVETYNAIMPAMVTLPGSVLIGITTAYRRAGLAYEKWQKHYAQDDPDVLVVYGTSRQFNKMLPQSIIDAAIERDPDAARAEWLSEWRSDISDFIDRALVEAAISQGILVRPAQPNTIYKAFVDPSGGRGDSFTCAISHAEDTIAVLDLIYERKSPFDPSLVVAEIAGLLREYKIGSVTGDKYAAGWVTEAFQKQAIRYEASERNRSEIYLDSLPLLTSGRARLLDNARLTHQLVNLERRASRGGKEVVDHPPGSHDDVANAAAGALVLVAADKTAVWKRPWNLPTIGLGGHGGSAVLRAQQPSQGSQMLHFRR